VALLARTAVAQRRGLGAWVLYVVFLAVLLAVPGPPRALYAVTSAALAVVTCWLVVATAPADRHTAALFATAAGGPARLHAALVGAAALVAAPLGVIAVLAGFLMGTGRRPIDLLVGLGAHATGLLVGAGIGAVAARAVTGDASLSLAVAIGLLTLVLGVPASSPLGPVVRALGHDAGRNASYALLVGCLAGALLLAVVLTAVGGVIAARRRTYGIAAPES
jgi:hypothetical protein